MVANEAVDMLRTVARARAASRAETWRDAMPLWEAIVEANPFDAEFWQLLGEACFGGGSYERAIAAYERAFELGFRMPAEMVYAMARCHARLGDRDQALAELQLAFDLGFRHVAHAQADPDFASLRDDAGFRELVMLTDTSGLSRDEGWWGDLALMVREVKRLGYAPFKLISESEFDAQVAALHDAIPGLTDAQIAVELMKLLRLVNDGHTRFRDLTALPEFRQTLPVQFWLFAEGLFIVATAPEHEDLLGAHVMTLGGHEVGELFQALDPLISRDNIQWPKQMFPYHLREVALLHALGLVPEPRRVELALRDRDGRERTVTVETDESQPDIWYAIPAPTGWRYLPETLPTPAPHYLRNAWTFFWFDYLAEEQTVYCQFNRVRDGAEETLADFTARLFRFIEEHPVEKFVLDLRWNNGGNTFLEMPLLHKLIGCEKINQRGRLFVIVGRRTFSAAQNLATLIERHTNAIFAGEPTGSSPNFVGESIQFELPYSKLKGTISDLYWQSAWPMDHRTWIAPRLYAPPTFAAYAENRDPALEAVLACDALIPGL
jgi:tetratricopeptide (TPR) repeat protein